MTTGLQGLLGAAPGEIPANPPGSTTAVSSSARLLPPPSSPGCRDRIRYPASAKKDSRSASITLDGKKGIIIAAATDKGVLYGVFRFLRLLQTHHPLQALDITEIPAYHYRILDHWDNLNRFVERGYAGLSLWNWFTLPTYKDPRYTDYARANASVGINGTVLNNVNASPLILTPEWLAKAAALADIFRPFGIRIYLSVNWAPPSRSAV